MVWMPHGTLWAHYEGLCGPIGSFMDPQLPDYLVLSFKMIYTVVFHYLLITPIPMLLQSYVSHQFQCFNQPVNLKFLLIFNDPATLLEMMFIYKMYRQNLQMH